MAAGIKKRVRLVRECVDREITRFARSGGRYSAGLASEGYLGGYRDALDDVLLALNHVEPNRWEHWNSLEQ